MISNLTHRRSRLPEPVFPSSSHWWWDGGMPGISHHTPFLPMWKPSSCYVSSTEGKWLGVGGLSEVAGERASTWRATGTCTACTGGTSTPVPNGLKEPEEVCVKSNQGKTIFSQHLGHTADLVKAIWNENQVRALQKMFNVLMILIGFNKQVIW